MAADDLLHLVQGGNNTKLELERLYDAISANGYPRIHVIEGIPPDSLGNPGDICYSTNPYPQAPGPWVFGPKADTGTNPWGDGFPLVQGPPGVGIEDEVFWVGLNKVTKDFEVPLGHNAMSAGPLKVEAVVTVPEDSQWTIVGEEDYGPHYLRDLEDVEVGATVTDGHALIWINHLGIWAPGPAPKGDDGIDGTPGQPGAEGPPGQQGPKGERGPQGPQGIQGAEGPKGPKGDDGPEGPEGPQGDQGMSLNLLGEKPTEGDLPSSGNDMGDAWLITSTGELWFYGEDGVWHNAGHVVGPQGPPGPKGDPGQKGDPGLPGVDGSQGIEGPQGDEGPRGPQGNPGQDSTVPGPKGDKGDPGEGSSVPGPPGSDGEDGEDGAKGEPGEKGDPGDPGQDGQDGADGEPFEYEDFTPEQLEGLQGPPGNDGIQGDPGQDGAPGTPGEKGDKGDAFEYEDFTVQQLDDLKGEQGEPGIQGDPGQKGPQGDKGDPFEYEDFTMGQLEDLTGPEGPEGPPGPEGPQGIALHPLGSIEGVGDLGDLPGPHEVGDAYLVNETGDLWYWGADDDWHNAGHVVGPPGADGSEGPPGADSTVPGPEGPPGEKGDQGDPFEYEDFTPSQLDDLTGPKGDQGLPGDDGEDGEKGDKGDPGQKGDPFEYEDFTPQQLADLKGEKGDPGRDGIDGNDGEQGPPGDDGEDGEPGEKGDDGAAGVDGKGWTGGYYMSETGVVTFTSDDNLGFSTDDIRGDDGEKGEPGSQGNPGQPGEQGPEGDQGPRGPEGPQGIQGAPGAGIQFQGEVDTYEDLPGYPDSYTSVYPSGQRGDAFMAADTGHLWVWGESHIDGQGDEKWIDAGEIQGPEGPQGPEGDRGADGRAATVDVGGTTTGQPGTAAAVTNSGTTTNAIFNFTIPRGDKGDPGDPFDPNGDYTITGQWDFQSNGNSFTGDGTDLVFNDEMSIDIANDQVQDIVVTHLEDVVNNDDRELSSLALERTDNYSWYTGMVPARVNSITMNPARGTVTANKFIGSGEDLTNLPASGVQLDNEESWEVGQYNEHYLPTNRGTNNTPVYDNFSAEENPNIKIYHNGNELALLTLQPYAPTKPGVFIAVTWIPFGDSQVFQLGNTFDESCRVWENPGSGLAQTRVYTGLAGGLNKWYEVG